MCLFSLIDDSPIPFADSNSTTDQNLVNKVNHKETFLDHSFMALPSLPPYPTPSSSLTPVEDCPVVCDFSNVVLKYINQILMEEDAEDRTCMFQECLALQIAEKSFYDILGENYPSLSNQTPYVHHTANIPIPNFTGNRSNYDSCINSIDPDCDLGEEETLPVYNTSQSLFNSLNNIDGRVGDPLSTVWVSDLSNESLSVLQFRRGVEEASKFLPNCTNLIVDLESNGSLPWEPKEEEAREVVVEGEKKDEGDYSPNGSRGRKNHHREDIDLEEGRSNKQSATYADETVKLEVLDMVLLWNDENGKSPSSTLQEAWQNGQLTRSSGGKARGKKQGGKREVVDLRTLLSQCAQSVTANDYRSANELLKQIREHSSPFGDGSERLAHYFANGLEARLAGTGTKIYVSLYAIRTPSADILKAYHVLLTACPFRKIGNFFSNQTIINTAENAARLHIIDFGITYGFQWPSLIQLLSERPGGPPMLRITGIEFPQPGFRPAERVEETGRRIANYAERFNVPFKYKAIAQKWETIQIEDLKIDGDEVLVVNCLFRFEHLLDESVVVDCPRNAVLNLIRRMNPDVFIHGVVNGTYSAPFFVTRFREALFHFSALFDMFETIVPRENQERMVLEREILGREALNVIACEGSERVERPETFRQWQVRNLRAGFRQLSLNQEIMKMARDWVASSYHKDFVIDRDSQWMLLGWKGRIIYALSSWKPGGIMFLNEINDIVIGTLTIVMDPLLRGFSGSMNGFKSEDESVSFLLDQNFVNGPKLEETLFDHNFMDLPFFPPDPTPSDLASSSSASPEGDSSLDFDFSDTVLKFISQILMEEDMEEKSCMFQESLALQIAEKSFCEILCENYPNQPPSFVDHNAKNPNDMLTANYSNYDSCSNLVDPICDLGEFNSFHAQTVPVDYTSQSTFQSSISSLSSVNNSIDGLVDSPPSTNWVSDSSSESHLVRQFRRGVEEASKFLPNCNLIVDLENNGSSLRWEPNVEAREVVEKKDERDYSPNGSTGRKNHRREDIELEERRSNKQSAAYSEETVQSEVFDMVLLCNEGNDKSSLSSLRESLLNEQSKGPNGGKARSKKQGHKREVVDLRTLLIHCAQAVSTDDRKTANELLKQIREHSSPFGDGSQRLADCFADGLEARLASTGTQMHAAIYAMKTSAADILKAYQLLLASCPFKNLAIYFTKQTIMNIVGNATRVHIIDFGILYGFQWPCLIQRLSARPGGPPKLRITGIELPQPGFRPAKRVEETGRRLANYAERFNVPFEYNAIAQKWETVRIEDLKIDGDEVLVVNCLYRFRHLLDETVVADSPKDAVLNLIRKMNPDVFIHGIVNGTYSSPFFVTRFREALFHFSALFDMFETVVPRENQERMVLEREIYGREAQNVIACEGSERVERPETYKQWQVRTLRAGFRQLPLNKETMKMARDRVKSSYHKDFVIDEDSEWMLQGWKGRIIYAISCWKPAFES
ncbi:hypothetical protein HHK36_016386 [Tetracentron sinense]|uniref:Uncharacterized protein n=1 Tax=Tetracentron sinense TaxID=13715 RepID=A0A834YX40_TETSI|nr:hypothetical protein HHK36_016386 [Tetracentron sinense]